MCARVWGRGRLTGVRERPPFTLPVFFFISGEKLKSNLSGTCFAFLRGVTLGNEKAIGMKSVTTVEARLLQKDSLSYLNFRKK